MSRPKSSAIPPLRDHSADHRMVMLAAAALVVGVGGAAGAWLLLRLIALAGNLFWHGTLSVAAPTRAMPMGAGAPAWLVFVLPVAGSLLIGLMARFGSDKIRGHGIPEAIEAILYGESRLSLKVAVLKPLSSAISIGSGGPFGAEGPVIMTGGAIGSLLAQCLHLSAAERKTLLVAGAAAGMTGIFGTPAAAILLALEVLLFEWKPRSFVPVVVAVLVAHGLRPVWIGAGPMFPAGFAIPGGAGALAGGLGLGAIVGFEAGLLSLALYRLEDMFHRLPLHWMWWPALGGAVVGAGALVDRRVLGAGYGNLQALLDGGMSVHAVATLLVAKAAVWLVALASGTSGGVLAPLLMLGGAAGAIIGGTGFWAMLGMAGIIGGAMRAPFTGAVFAVELTGRFEALPHALACAAGAYAVSVLAMRRSILTEKIARRGRHVRQEYSVDPLELFQAAQIMTRDPQVVPATMTVAEASALFAGPGYRSYPVVDAHGALVGMIARDDVLAWTEGAPDPAASLGEVLSDASSPSATPQTPVGEVADTILHTGKPRLPVVGADGRVVGIVTRHDLLKARHAARLEETRRSGLLAG